MFHNCTVLFCFFKNISQCVCFPFPNDFSSVIQQRAGMSWCWLVTAFHCGPVITQPLSVSLSGAVLLNNLFRMTQIAVRGWLTNARIFHCHTLLLMEKHQLLIISCLFFLLLIGDLPRGSAFNKAPLKSISRFFLIIKKTLLNFLAPPGSCGLRFQVPNTCQQDPSLTASSALTL